MRKSRMDNTHALKLPAQSLPYLSSYYPVLCQICSRPFETYETVWQYCSETYPRCSTCTPVFNERSSQYWYRIMIVLLNPIPQCRPNVGHTNPNEVRRACEVCHMIALPAGKCGVCGISTCIRCWDSRLIRCSLFCPFKSCQKCDTLHNCPNILS